MNSDQGGRFVQGNTVHERYWNVLNSTIYQPTKFLVQKVALGFTAFFMAAVGINTLTESRPNQSPEKTVPEYNGKALLADPKTVIESYLDGKIALFEQRLESYKSMASAVSEVEEVSEKADHRVTLVENLLIGLKEIKKEGLDFYINQKRGHLIDPVEAFKNSVEDFEKQAEDIPSDSGTYQDKATSYISDLADFIMQFSSQEVVTETFTVIPTIQAPVVEDRITLPKDTASPGEEFLPQRDRERLEKYRRGNTPNINQNGHVR